MRDGTPGDGEPRPTVTDHHDPAGGYRNPWLPEEKRPSGLRWMFQRITQGVPPNPEAWEYPRADPELRDKLLPEDEAPADGWTTPADGRSGKGRGGRGRPSIRATWVGHATFLLQIGGFNVLTDPHWGERASPFSWAGPRRLTEPGIPFDDLPRIDVVVLSHDHYDHLDRSTVRRLAVRFGSSLRWLVPLGHGRMLRGWGAEAVREMDWYDREYLGGGTGAPLDLTFLPSQHWTARTPFRRNDRLWGSWSIAVGGVSVYFGGDSGWFPGYAEIGRRAGPFDLLLLPIGAYEPRWFMKTAHMNPEEAVRAYRALGGEGVFCGMHWGTFRLTDEHPLEPPVRLEKAWREEAGLPDERLWIPALGETRIVEPEKPFPATRT